MQHTAVAQFSQDQLALIRQTVAKDTTPQEFNLFVEVCKYRGLNPFARQIYAIIRNAGDPHKRQLTIQTSIDGYRLLAEKSGLYAGQIGPEWCGEDGVWHDVWLSDKPPVAARVGILRKDFSQPTWGIAKYKAFYVETNPLWKKMPDHMLSIRAESIGLRKAFPDQMSGIYTREEMEQADHDLPTVAPMHVVEVEPSDVHAQASPQNTPKSNLDLHQPSQNTQAANGTQLPKNRIVAGNALAPSDIDTLKSEWSVVYAIPETQIDARWPKYLRYLLEISEPDLKTYHKQVIKRDLDRQKEMQVKASVTQVSSVPSVAPEVQQTA